MYVCVKACKKGKNNIKEGGPHGSRAPSGRLRRQLKKTNHAVPAVRGSVSGACLGHGRGPRLSQNLCTGLQKATTISYRV